MANKSKFKKKPVGLIDGPNRSGRSNAHIIYAQASSKEYNKVWMNKKGKFKPLNRVQKSLGVGKRRQRKIEKRGMKTLNAGRDAVHAQDRSDFHKRKGQKLRSAFHKFRAKRLRRKFEKRGGVVQGRKLAVR